MKKIFSIVLIASAALSVFTSCKNEMEEIFSESAAERLNHTQAKYSKLLTSSQNGWAFEYYPTASADDGAVLYAVKFSTDGSVDVAGDPFVTGVIGNEISCWDIIADNGPVLSFSTYNKLIHQFSDPMDDGMGYEGDYEFAFVYSETENPDSVIMLKGKKRGLYSRLKMIDEDATPAEYLTDCAGKQAELFPSTAKNYVILHIGDDLVRMDDMNTGVPDTYIYGKDKVLFAKPNSYIFVKYSGKYYTRFNKNFVSTDSTAIEKNFVYDEETQELVGVDNPNVRITPPHYATFITDETLGAAVTWRLAKTSEMSDEFASVWNAAVSAMSKKNNTMTECTLSTTNADENGNVTFTIRYKPKTGAARDVYYKYNLTQDGDKVTLAYVEPYNSGAATILQNFPECEALLKAIAGTYTVENPGQMSLVINSLKLVGSDGMSYSLGAKYVLNSSESGM